jgi:hypothetical protein
MPYCTGTDCCPIRLARDRRSKINFFPGCVQQLPIENRESSGRSYFSLRAACRTPSGLLPHVLKLRDAQILIVSCGFQL